MRKTLILAAALSSLAASTAAAQTFETVDKSPAGDRFEESANFDILGFRPGDTIEQVKEKMAELYPDDEPAREVRLEGNVAHPNGSQVPINFVSQSKRGSDSDLPPIYRNGKAGDWPVAYFASEVYDNRVLTR